MKAPSPLHRRSLSRPMPVESRISHPHPHTRAAARWSADSLTRRKPRCILPARELRGRQGTGRLLHREKGPKERGGTGTASTRPEIRSAAPRRPPDTPAATARRGSIERLPASKLPGSAEQSESPRLRAADPGSRPARPFPPGRAWLPRQHGAATSALAGLHRVPPAPGSRRLAGGTSHSRRRRHAFTRPPGEQAKAGRPAAGAPVGAP